MIPQLPLLCPIILDAPLKTEDNPRRAAGQSTLCSRWFTGALGQENMVV